MINKSVLFFLISASFFVGCKKSGDDNSIPQTVIENFSITNVTVNNNNANAVLYNVPYNPSIKISFSVPIKTTAAPAAVTLKNGTSTITINTVFQNGDKDILVQPSSPLNPLTKYTITVNTNLTSALNTGLNVGNTTNFITAIDSTDKFPVITDNALLDKVQQQTFKYFWDFGHPVSGMARERNTSNEVVTTGGTGFGVMAIVAASSRGFITRSDAAARVLKITNFLLNNCTRYHGAFAHWVNGATGVTIPFSANDNGGDLVETSLLLQGLITARQYFSTTDITETDVRNKINTIYNGEWNWYRQNNQNVLYWHWSTDKSWIINQQISGWNEALIVYALAASAPTPANRIPPTVYTNGWASNGAMVNNNTYFGFHTAQSI